MNDNTTSTNKLQYATQYFVDKVGKNKAFSVMESRIDYDNKRIEFKIAKDDTHGTNATVTFDEAKKMFGWDDFTFSNDKSLIYPTINGYEPLPKPEEYKSVDEHFLDANYNWMSVNRITNPMNNSTEGVREINEQLHRNGGVYYSKNSHPIDGDALDNLILAARAPQQDSNMNY